jgi:hypothetical protein
MQDGKVALQLGGTLYKGTWRVDGRNVEVVTSVGSRRAPLGGLIHAPKSVAATVLRELAIEDLKRTNPRGTTARVSF